MGVIIDLHVHRVERGYASLRLAELAWERMECVLQLEHAEAAVKDFEGVAVSERSLAGLAAATELEVGARANLGDDEGARQCAERTLEFMREETAPTIALEVALRSARRASQLDADDDSVMRESMAAYLRLGRNNVIIAEPKLRDTERVRALMMVVRSAYLLRTEDAATYTRKAYMVATRCNGPRASLLERVRATNPWLAAQFDFWAGLACSGLLENHAGAVAHLDAYLNWVGTARGGRIGLHRRFAIGERLVCDSEHRAARNAFRSALDEGDRHLPRQTQLARGVLAARAVI